MLIHESSNQLINIFDDTASHYDKVDYLPCIIGNRLISRLEEFHNFQPKNILDLGCGTGLSLHLLQQRYPSSRLVGVDWSLKALKKAKQALAVHGDQVELIQENMTQSAFANDAFDLIYANLGFLWIHDLVSYLMRLKHFLKPGGLLLFTLFGLDTFEPLRQNSSIYPFGFSDIHPLGDMLVNTKWKDVVVDVDHLMTKHNSAADCYKEIKQLGLHTLFVEPNNLWDIPQALTPSGYHLNWEIIYAQAWNLDQFEDTTQAGEVSVPISDLITY